MKSTYDRTFRFVRWIVAGVIMTISTLPVFASLSASV